MMHALEEPSRVKLASAVDDAERRLLDMCRDLNRWQPTDGSYSDYGVKRLNGEQLLCDLDRRWLNIAITHFEEGFMALKRSIDTKNSQPLDKSEE